jgi:hypothetical protein
VPVLDWCVETVEFQELNNDQRREAVNTRQRYAALREAEARARAYRGSMVWTEVKSRQYLVRSAYDKTGLRRQTSIGLRSPDTEQVKAEYERGRADAEVRLKDIRVVVRRQAAINRAVGLGRVPLLGSRIIRALDNAGMLGSGIRVLGTNALYAYEAAAGIHLDPGLTTTEDIDLLFDSRGGLTSAATEDVSERSLLHLLRKVDRSFQKASQQFRAVNNEGYLVDLIKPLRDPPWAADRNKVGANGDDLAAVEIEGLSWHESAPAFEAVAVDERGEPLRIVTSDPRVFAAHKLWLSKRPERDALRRRRDEVQARAVAELVARHLQHLPFVSDDLRMLPRDVFEAARPLFRIDQA